jgi:hypothetical protein
MSSPTEIQRSITLQASGLTAVAKGKALIISGELLKTGTWVGLDNVPTTYSQKFLENLYPSLPGKPIRFAHPARYNCRILDKIQSKRNYTGRKRIYL